MTRGVAHGPGKGEWGFPEVLLRNQDNPYSLLSPPLGT